MAIGLGTRVGPYEVTVLIGEGGMGKVWRAHHAALKRDDALKVLPDAFVSDPERLARFQREAQVLASLNHPNIAHVYGLEQTDGVQALVMELVEGPTLADRIAQGPIPVDEALPIARQIAEALEAAHEQGIIHRDLKPANIKVRPDGTVKVLDFGLAKALEPMSTRAIDATASPTITSPAMMTGVGMLLGTAAYMSPEQARGKAVDNRSDIWAFGCVLYEMLTGQRAFGGEDVTETLASVVKTDPAWGALPDGGMSPTVRTFLRRCLQKNPKQRLHDIADMRLALEGAFETERPHWQQLVNVPQPVWRRPLPVAGATAIVAILLAGLAAWSLWPMVEPLAVNRFAIDLPADQQLRNTGRHVMAFSRDGRHVVYNTTTGLYLRTMGSLEAQLIPGTESSLTNPFLSPDGTSVGYWQAGQLKRLAISGGAPVVICNATNPYGVSWEADNTLLFAQAAGIMRVSADGGTPELVVRAENGEQMHGPQLLPDGDTVLFSVTTSTASTRWDEARIVGQSLRTGQRMLLVAGGSDARYLPTGHLVYALGDGLFAVAFDADALMVSGGPVSILQGVMRVPNPQLTTAAANFDISDDGTLVYVAGTGAAAPPRTLVWVDRTGREEPLPAPMRLYQYPRLSPDGTRIALDIRDEGQDIWIWDLARHTLTRLTFDPGNDQYPVWTPDSRRLIFSSNRAAGSAGLYWQAADGASPGERLTEAASNNFHYATSVSPDGTQVLFRLSVSDPGSGVADDLMRVVISPHPSAGAHAPTALVRTMFNERNAEVAPGGRWLAYESNESGREEIYVRPFPNVDDGRWQISTQGGRAALWSRDGQELFYLSPDGVVMGVRVEQGTSWRNSTPARVLTAGLYHQPTAGATGRTYDVSRDGRRFLMLKESAASDVDAAPPSIVVVQAWTEELKRLVPTN